MKKASNTKKPTRATKTKTNAAETNLIRRVALSKKAQSLPEFRSGDTVSVHVKVKEGEKERVQIYKGVVTKIQGSGVGRSFTVRKISAGVGVERTFPFASPAVDKVEVAATGKVRRAKLYYLRELDGKAAKIESELAIGREETTSSDEATPS